ncbi:MAG: hypothetical protein ACXW4B_00245 [Micavibrio sp.]
MAKPEHFIALKMASDCELSLYTFRDRQNDGAGCWQKTRFVQAGKMMATHTNWVEPEDREFYQTLLVPVSRPAAESLRALINLTVMNGGVIRENRQDPDNPVVYTEGDVPFYFSMDMLPDARFERKGMIPRLMGGPETRYFSDSVEMKVFSDDPPRPSGILKRIWRELTWRADDSLERYTNRFEADPESMPLARVNCWTFAQGLTEYYARVDLSAIDPMLSKSHRAWQAQTWFFRQFGTPAGGLAVTRHPAVEYSKSDSSEDRLLVMQNDPARQPALLVMQAKSFLDLADKPWIDQTGTEISPLKSPFSDDLALFGDAALEHERPLPPLPPGPKP